MFFLSREFLSRYLYVYTLISKTSFSKLLLDFLTRKLLLEITCIDGWATQLIFQMLARDQMTLPRKKAKKASRKDEQPWRGNNVGRK